MNRRAFGPFWIKTLQPRTDFAEKPQSITINCMISVMGLDMEMVMRLVSTCHKVSRIIQSSKRSKVLLTHISRATKNSCHSYCVALKYFNLVNRSRGPKAYFGRRRQALARQQMEAKKRKAPLLKKRFGGFSLSTASAECADQTSRVFVPRAFFRGEASCRRWSADVLPPN